MAGQFDWDDRVSPILSYCARGQTCPEVGESLEWRLPWGVDGFVCTLQILKMHLLHMFTLFFLAQISDIFMIFCRWKLITHGCIDGFSRKIIFLHYTNNKAHTVLDLFCKGTEEHCLPLQVWGDQGKLQRMPMKPSILFVWSWSRGFWTFLILLGYVSTMMLPNLCTLTA